MTKLQGILGYTESDLAAIPPPLQKIRELEEENQRLQRENDDLRRTLVEIGQPVYPGGRVLPQLSTPSSSGGAGGGSSSSGRVPPSSLMSDQHHHSQHHQHASSHHHPHPSQQPQHHHQQHDDYRDYKRRRVAGNDMYMVSFIHPPHFIIFFASAEAVSSTTLLSIFICGLEGTPTLYSFIILTLIHFCHIRPSSPYWPMFLVFVFSCSIDAKKNFSGC